MLIRDTRWQLSLFSFKLYEVSKESWVEALINDQYESLHLTLLPDKLGIGVENSLRHVSDEADHRTSLSRGRDLHLGLLYKLVANRNICEVTIASPDRFSYDLLVRDIRRILIYICNGRARLTAAAQQLFNNDHPARQNQNCDSVRGCSP